MNFYKWHYFFLIGSMFLGTNIRAEIFMVNSQQSFDNAHDSASMNDSIIWEKGSFPDIYMNISKDHLFIGTVELGNSIFTGASRVRITGDYVILKGLQFVGGDIGSNDVINTSGSYNHFDQINIRAYTSYKYLVIREESQYVNVTNCNFENRLNLDDKNILSILVDETNPGYHKVQYCSFKNFDGTGNDMGIEPIRIGLSTQADRISRSLVEYCYFTQCNGDGEIISNKARQNVFRYNTFDENPKAELVLRHGSESIVYANFFLNGKGGVRVREGQHQYIYNNYFFNLDDRAIYLQNEASDPLEDINIAFNTIINCEAVILGGDGSYKPVNVTLANNIFTDPIDKLFEDPTGTENWIGNLAFGTPGITLPPDGLTTLDPELEENTQGFYGLSENSPAINAAETAYALLPQFEGMEPIDTHILLDLMGQERPAIIEEKDLGCNEYPHNNLITPFATEENTGPDYNTSTVNKVHNYRNDADDLFHFYPNPVRQRINIEFNNRNLSNTQFKIIDQEGKLVHKRYFDLMSGDYFAEAIDLEDLPASLYYIQMISQDNGNKWMQSKVFIKE